MDQLTTNDQLLVALQSFPVEWLRKQAPIMASALMRMISAETDWYDGEIGVGHRFRAIARQAIQDVIEGDLIGEGDSHGGG